MGKAFCEKCGKPVKIPIKFCPECGEPLFYSKEEFKELRKPTHKKNKGLKAQSKHEKYMSPTALLITIIIGMLSYWVVSLDVKLWYSINCRLNSINEFAERSDGAFCVNDFGVPFGKYQIAIAEKTLHKYGEISVHFCYYPYESVPTPHENISISLGESPEFVTCTFTTGSTNPTDSEIAECAANIINWVIYKADYKKVRDIVDIIMNGSSSSYKGYEIKISKQESESQYNYFRLSIGTNNG